MTSIVEVRFDCTMQDLTREQVEGLLKAHDSDLNIDVGLGYGGKAAVTFDVEDLNNATALAEQVAQTSRDLGLTVTDTEVLSEEEYAERAFDEAEVDPNG